MLFQTIANEMLSSSPYTVYEDENVALEVKKNPISYIFATRSRPISTHSPLCDEIGTDWIDWRRPVGAVVVPVATAVEAAVVPVVDTITTHLIAAAAAAVIVYRVLVHDDSNPPDSLNQSARFPHTQTRTPTLHQRDSLFTRPCR